MAPSPSVSAGVAKPSLAESHEASEQALLDEVRRHPLVEAALKAYKSGERPHATMHAQAATLSDQDIADVAAFLSAHPAN